MTPIPPDIIEYNGDPWFRPRKEEARKQFKQDDEALFGSESKYLALLRIAKELKLCCDYMGNKPGTEDPEIVARARSASVQLNQLLGNE